jgi:hypothetical protein
LWYIDSLVLRNPLLRKAAKRYKQAWEKNSDMKIDKTTYKDRKERQIAMTADHTSRPDKVLFFADPHFLFFKSRPTLHTLSSRMSRHTNQSLPKSAILPTLPYRLILSFWKMQKHWIWSQSLKFYQYIF